uniref:ATP-dependent DNA helicase PIF1-like n=1 Tax=Tanacetum cinerariifolium TaxID=118510 RepID=A0A699H2Q8_TANCI|nr:ATP-dependent DNA helicase PIF1-like [Tanacetum cinerariifolium]
MECDEGHIYKKLSTTSPEILLDVTTMSAENDYLQMSQAAHMSVEIPKHSVCASVNANTCRNGNKVSAGKAYKNQYQLHKKHAVNEAIESNIGRPLGNNIAEFAPCPYVYRISGQIYHWIGSTCPEEGQSPRFFQLYIYDITNEVKNRLSYFGNEHESELKEEIVEAALITDIRREYLSGIYDAIVRGDRDGSDISLRTVLTASFTGSPRYMYAHYLDALAICQVLSLVNRQQHVYLSLDEAMPYENDGGETELLYLPEYLNSLNSANFPPHRLELKLGGPIIHLCNLNISGGLCNKTQLIVTQLLSKVIEARIITETQISEKVFLPRIPLINRDLQLPFIFKRKQFPIKLCYVMTINKIQGQSLERIGIFLPEPVFAHGQLYVALSRATSPNGLKILIKHPTHGTNGMTKNIVYMDFLATIAIAQLRFGQKARRRYPNFTLDVVLKPVTAPLLTLPAPEPLKSPATKILEGPSIANEPTTTDEGVSQST